MKLETKKLLLKAAISAAFGISAWALFLLVTYLLFGSIGLAGRVIPGITFVTLFVLFGILISIIKPNAKDRSSWLNSESDINLTRFSMDRTADSIFWIDSEARFMDVNIAACKNLNYTREELLTMTVHDIDPDFTAEKWPSHWQELKNKKSFIIESRHRTKDGSIIPVEIAINYLKQGDKEYNCAIVRDISKRKEAEVALKESEEKFRNLADQSPNMIFINKGGKIVYVNKKCQEITGYSKDDFYSSDFDFFQLISPEYVNLIKENYRKHMSGQEVDPYEYALKSKDGKKITVMINTKVIQYEGENSLLGIVTDITERKLSEVTIKESEEKFRNLAEQSPNMIFINKRGRIVYVNEKSVEVMGYTREEFYSPGFDFLNTISPEYIDSIKETFEKHMQDMEAEPYEYAIITKKGHRLDVINSTRLIKYEGEMAILGIVTDISERKKAERALKKSRKDLMKAQQMANIGNWEFDLKEDKITWSDQMYKIFGLTNGNDLTVDCIRKVIYPEDLTVFENAVKEVFSSVPPKAIEYRLIKKDGEIAHVYSTSEAQYDDQGNPVAIIGTVQDITERKRAEELREKLISDLQQAASEIKTLSGFIPICASCKKIRDDRGYWEQIETYIMERSDAEFSHGLCPDCTKKLYPDLQ